MLSHLKKLRDNMSLKIHFLDAHLDLFPDVLGHFSDEQGERFHQNTAFAKECFKKEKNCHLLGYYFWRIRKSKKFYKRMG